MTQPAIHFDGAGKKFCHSVSAAILYALQDFARKSLRLNPLGHLRKDEFWALRDISFEAGPGECIGIIGPNGAGKSTLLKLANRDHRPDSGRIVTRGRVKSLIRLGSGLQPLLTGRENIYVQCTALGLSKREIDGRLDGIVAFAGLEKSLDAPVKHYSDGMYARLEFSIATCRPMDVLLIDEVLAVGDIAFQMRCLDRLAELKRDGTAILFVSHSEMNIRHAADRCLLLFDGEPLAFGATDALFLKYYEALGYLDRKLKPLGLSPDMPVDFATWVSIRHLRGAGQESGGTVSGHAGRPLEFEVEFAASRPLEQTELVLQFWNSAGFLLASTDSVVPGIRFELPAGMGRLRVRLPFLALTPGIYRVAGGFRSEGRWLCYGGDLLRLAVRQDAVDLHPGLVSMPAEISSAP